MDLALHTLIGANMDCRRGPPLGYGKDQECHALFGKSHEAVIVVFVDEIERSANILSDSYAKMN